MIHTKTDQDHDGNSDRPDQFNHSNHEDTVKADYRYSFFNSQTGVFTYRTQTGQGQNGVNNLVYFN